MKKVSVIVPNYNNEKCIERCLNSLIKQTYKNVEIIIVDDGSSDNSLKLCKEYSKKDSRIIVYSKKNRGPSSARNYGFKKSTGDYIVFVDSDDYLNDNAIELMIKNIKNNDILICNYERFDDKGGQEKQKNFVNDNYSYFEFILLNKCWEPWGKLVKKEVLKKMFNEKYYIAEDLLFWFENSNYINNYNYLNIPVYNYYLNSNSLIGSSINSNKLYSSLEIIDFILKKSKSKIIEDKLNHLYFCTVYRLNKAVKLDDIILCKYNYLFKKIIKSKYISFKEKTKCIMRLLVVKLLKREVRQ